MKIYLAARYGAKDQVEALAQRLIAEGQEIVSTWHSPNKVSVPYGKVTPKKMRKEALNDLADLQRADTIVACEVFGDNGSRGARHCEFGFGLAMEYMLVVYGERWQCFHYLPEVYVVKTEKSLINLLKKNTIQK